LDFYPDIPYSECLWTDPLHFYQGAYAKNTPQYFGYQNFPEYRVAMLAKYQFMDNIYLYYYFPLMFIVDFIFTIYNMSLFFIKAFILNYIDGAIQYTAH